MKGMAAFILPLLVLISFSGQAQEMPPGHRTFTSLEEALQQPDSVYSLSLRKNRLTQIPKEVFLLKNLERLDLSRNRISVIPDELSSLKNLRELDLSKNELTQISPAVGELENLIVLRLYLNNITALPAQLGQLTKLEVLDIWGTELEYFPDELARLTSLKVLDLRVILIEKEQQKRLQELLPNAKIHFSNTCNCGF